MICHKQYFFLAGGGVGEVDKIIEREMYILNVFATSSFSEEFSDILSQI